MARGLGQGNLGWRGQGRRCAGRLAGRSACVPPRPLCAAVRGPSSQPGAGASWDQVWGRCSRAQICTQGEGSVGAAGAVASPRSQHPCLTSIRARAHRIPGEMNKEIEIYWLGNQRGDPRRRESLRPGAREPTFCHFLLCDLGCVVESLPPLLPHL